MAITLINNQDFLELPEEKIKTLSSYVIDDLWEINNLPPIDYPFELSFLFTTNSNIASLHNHYFNDPTPTDVITFSMRDGEDSHLHPHLLGDAIISIEMAIDNAKFYNCPPLTEVFRLVIHAILHIFGFNDQLPSEAKTMREKEDHYLKCAPL